MVFESAVKPRLTSPYAFKSLVIRRASPLLCGRNQICVPMEEDSGWAVMIRPLPSASERTRPILDHFCKPTGCGLPPATGTSTTVEYPAPAPLNMPQAIRFPSGDHDGPAIENSFGCLTVAIVRGSPLPSVFATISDVPS